MPILSANIKTTGEQIAAVTAAKNDAYGDAVSATRDILRILYPEGVSPDQYHNLLLITRVCDKLARLTSPQYPSDSESPWKDIAGYALIACTREVSLPKE